MTAAEIFAPIVEYQLSHGRKTTNKQISADTGITEHRISQLKTDPNRATLAELKALTAEYHYHIMI